MIVRFAFKIYTNLDTGPDDWVALLTSVGSMAAMVINCLGLAGNGLGRDIWTLSGDEITGFLFYFFINSVLYFWTVAMLKVVLLCLYLRLFQDGKLRQILVFTLAGTLLYAFGFLLTLVFACDPISYHWTRWDGEGQGKCIDVTVIAVAFSIISIVLDLWMLVIPLSQIKFLRLSRVRRMAAATMFLVGTL